VEKPFLTDAQLRVQLALCEYCEEKPCREACPARCSPANFIRAAGTGQPSDIARAAWEILTANPLGGVCGAVCPDRHCMAACTRAGLDRPVEIPSVQAALVQRAKDLGVLPDLPPVRPGPRKVAIVGAGPAGLGASAVLARAGVRVEVFEARDRAGGMCLDIPVDRLDPTVLQTDIAWLLRQGVIRLHLGRRVRDPARLRSRFDGVVVATGLDVPLRLGIPGERAAIDWRTWLEGDPPGEVRDRAVAVIGGGAVAVDCAEVARHRGASEVEVFALETLSEMPLTRKERQVLVDRGIRVSGRTRVVCIRRTRDGTVQGLVTEKVSLPSGVPFHPRRCEGVPGTRQVRPEFRVVVLAIGARPAWQIPEGDGIVLAGDLAHGPTTVVEAVASGKNAAARLLAAWDGTETPVPPRPTASTVMLAGRDWLPVPLDCDFFGIPLRSPFLLSAAPPSDGYDAVVKAYRAGWSGAVMKTAFDGVPVHIPGRYMVAFGDRTYGNCDNVSGHSLDRMCREIERLRREWPDRVTIGGTGGPVTGDDDRDARVWQSNTRKLEEAGASGIEYSLSCPQGGDGTKGDIVSQDAELTARIIDWVLRTGDPAVPKLFKLTAAVTSIHPILQAVREVFDRHPEARAGVTLANTFPVLALRPGLKRSWEEGIVVGMSGEGVAPISNLTLASASRHGLVISGNGGPMDHLAAAHFLALGARTVQFCTVALKYGVGVIGDLHQGLSWLLKFRGIPSVPALIGIALPDAITPFPELSAEKPVSAVREDLCLHCGNCTRCPYLAITLDDRKVPVTDPSRCVGCGLCALKCFSGAIFLRPRTPEEAAVLKEG